MLIAPGCVEQSPGLLLAEVTECVGDRANVVELVGRDQCEHVRILLLFEVSDRVLFPWLPLERLVGLARRGHKGRDPRAEGDADLVRLDVCVLDRVVKEPRHDHVLVTIEPVQDLCDSDRMGDVREVRTLPLLVHGCVRLDGEGERLLEAGICLTCHLSPNRQSSTGLLRKTRASVG